MSRAHRRPAPALWAGAAFGLLVVLTACSLDGGAVRPPAASAGAATVVRAVDGDTVIVRIGGTDEPVRLIGIDTPETVSRQRPIECFGPEAKHRTAELLPPGTRVLLERDVEARDAYDRLLAYVTRSDDGVFVNELLVAEGYAESSPYPPNLAHQDDLDRAEAAAQAVGRGLWPVCGGTDVPLERVRPVASPG